MRNKIIGAICGAVSAFWGCASWSLPVTGSNETGIYKIYDGEGTETCQISALLYIQVRTASVVLINKMGQSNTYAYAGAARWVTNAYEAINPSITEAALETCLGGTDITLMASVGADISGTFAGQQYMGIHFQILANNNGYAPGSYSFSIGNDPWNAENRNTDIRPGGNLTETFAANAQTIRQVVTDEANRSLRNTVSANQNMVQSARDRFADDMRQNAACSRDDQTDKVDGAYRDFQEVCTETVATRNYIPFDVDGAFSLSGATLSTNGTFFGQNGSADGTWRRLFFGDFNVQRDGNTGSNTATLSARVAWEQMVSETTMLGYFIGAELGDSDIKGSFTGDQSRVALTLGGYAVHQLAEQVYLDGFLTLGAGRNDLSMANSVLSLDSDYSTRTATLGAAVSGIYAYEAYEFHPELSFSYGRTWIGNVGFTGRADDVVDSTLSLDAGHVSVANLTFRPEVIWGLDGETVAGSNSQLSFAPRMICEQTRALRSTNDCGGGAELGLSTQSDDGLTNAEFRVLMDRIGSSDRTSYAINLEHRF